MKRFLFLLVLFFGAVYVNSAKAQSVAFGAGIDPMFGSVHLRGDVDFSTHLRLGLEWTKEVPVLLGYSSGGNLIFMQSRYLGAAIAVLQPLGERLQFYGRSGFGLRRSGFNSEGLSSGQFDENTLEIRLGGGIEYKWWRLRFFADAALRWKEVSGFDDPLVLAVGASFVILKADI